MSLTKGHSGKSDVSSKLRLRRQELGLRLVDLADLSGLSISEIWNLEHGMWRRANQDTKEKLAVSLGSEVNELFPQ